MNTPPDTFIGAANLRSMICGHEKFELGHILEVLTIKESGCNRVSASDLLDSGFGQLLTCVDLDRRHKPRSMKGCQIIGNALKTLDQESLRRCVLRVVPQDRPHRL